MKQADSTHDQVVPAAGNKVSWPASHDDIRHHLVYHHGFRKSDPLLKDEQLADLNAIHEDAHEDDATTAFIQHFH